ncbi:hypothetical protein N2152v2_004255 [Parachlorella kessleri]
MAARRDNVKDLFSAAPVKLSQEKEEAQRRRLEYAAELQAQIQAKAQSKRSEKEASLRQSLQLLEQRQGPVGASWDRVPAAAAGSTTHNITSSWGSSPNKPTGDSTLDLRYGDLDEGHHPPAHLWGHEQQVPSQEVYGIPEPLVPRGWQNSQEPMMPNCSAGSWSPAWGAAVSPPTKYGGSSISRSSLQGSLPVVPGTSYNPLGWSAGGMPRPHAASSAGGSQPPPGGARLSPAYQGNVMPLSHWPDGYPEDYSEVLPGMGNGEQQGFPPGSLAQPPNRAWDRYGTAAGALPPVAASSRPPQGIAILPGGSPLRAGAAAYAPFGTDLQQGDGWARRPVLQDGARNPGYEPANPVSGQVWLPSPTRLPEEKWGVASPGKLSAFGSADEEKRRKGEAQKAAYKAELEAQMQAKQDRQKKEKAERLQEDLRKEQEIGSLGGMGLPGKGGGYGGGSGPLRDDQGNIVTDLNKVRKYQQQQQVAKSLSASQATLQQLVQELQIADGNSPGGAASFAGVAHQRGSVRDQPAYTSAGAGLRDGRSRQHSMEAHGSDLHAWQLQHGRSENVPSLPARDGPAWPDQQELLLGSTSAAADVGSSQRPPSQPYQSTSPAGSGDQVLTRQRASAAETRGTGAVGGPEEARGGNNVGATGGAVVASMAAAKRGSNAAAGGSMTMNLRSDHPYMTATDVKRKQKQQESWKAALQQQMEEKRLMKEAELRREKELDAAEEHRLAKEQERLREAFERERGPQQKGGKKEQATNVGASTIESDGIMIKFKPPPASRRQPQQDAAAVAHSESSPGTGMNFKPPPARAVQGLGSGPWGSHASTNAGSNPSEETNRGFAPDRHLPGGSQGGHQYDLAAREDSIRAALAVQRREMQELRERAAAAEFNSSAARRQLETLTDMVRWQGAGASVGQGAYLMPYTQQQLPPYMIAPGAVRVLSREELVEPSLTGASSLIYLPQTALRPSNNKVGVAGNSQGGSQSKLGAPRPGSGRPPLPPPPRQQQTQQPQQQQPFPAGSPRPLTRSRTAGAAGSPRSILPLPPLTRRATVGHGPAAGSSGSASGSPFAAEQPSNTKAAGAQLPADVPEDNDAPRLVAGADTQGPDSNLEELDQFILDYESAGPGL